MELRVLRYYLTVAREENITRAAEVLHITQPTLSRQMADLEEELNTRLFERGNRRVTLTEAGIFLRRRAEELVELADKTAREFSTRDEELHGVVSVGSGVTAAVSDTLPMLLEHCASLMPQVRFELYTGSAAVIKDRLDKGLLDVGILMEPVEIEKYDFIRLPQKEVWGILMPEDAPLAQKAAIGPQDLRPMPLIVSWRIQERDAKAWFGGRVDDLHIFCTYDLIDNVIPLVERRLGYAFTIEGAYCPRDVLCFRPLSPAITNTSVLVWKKYQPLTPAVQRFIDCASNAYKA